jgi:hypothetical protein
MPGPSFNVPAAACKTGGSLRRIEGSVCSDCYAAKGRYFTVRVQKALALRLKRLAEPGWVDAMSRLIARRAAKAGYFRWHDSGDLQSIDHLRKVVEVCRKTPEILHWLPTREYALVQQFLDEGEVIPENLVVRLSAHMLDGAPPIELGLPVSTVSRAGSARPPEAYLCPQPSRGFHVCGSCRACWDSSVQWVDYRQR